jgi:hypothetical protein
MFNIRISSLKKTTAFFLITLFFLTSIFSWPLTASAQNQQISDEFIEEWYNTKYKLTVKRLETWALPETYDIEITIEITDMGDNEYLWINDIEVQVDAYLEERMLVDYYLYSVGEKYSIIFSLDPDTSFEYTEPEDTDVKTLSIFVNGEVKKVDSIYTSSMFTWETTEINVYAPPTPISIVLDTPDTILINETFNLNAVVTNEGDYEIKNVKVELFEDWYFSLIGESLYTISVLAPKESATFTFQLKGIYDGDSSSEIDVSFISINGFEVSDWVFPFCSKQVSLLIKKILNKSIST